MSDNLQHLLTVARAYGAAGGLELSAVSWRATGDSKKLPAIANGADIQVGRFEKTMRWFSDNWPDGVDWPLGVPRPAAQSVEVPTA